MPGAYTHITMVNRASARPNMEAFGIPTPAITACGRWLKYCELGVVSPDLPYLDVMSGQAKKWADDMHYRATDGVIRSVIESLRDVPRPRDDKDKGLAWLLGYTTHVVMDCTIHPVVNLRVGPYATNQKQHRICEMNQDAHIFQSLNLSITASRHLKSGMATCRGSDGKFDATIADLWADALCKVYPATIAGGAPDPAAWHGWFTRTVDAIGDGDSLLFAIGRHVVPGAGLIYPTAAEIDFTFIKDLKVPGDGKMHFDDVFEKAKRHVSEMWKIVACGALGSDEEYMTVLKQCDLDTGLDATGRMLFWEGA